ncbi:MAG: creatininase family protein [Chloroflexota bacterium]
MSDAALPAGAPEVRITHLRPAEVAAALARAPIAWLPMGAVEYHAEHLPFGTDGFTATAVVERAARLVGGVVLPWSALTMGTLALPWSLSYDADLVERALRSTIEQLAAHGARAVVVHTGHGPLDLSHLIKRVCAEVEATAPGGPDFRAYGVCYLELNAANRVQLGTDWPVAIDHGATIETSWALATVPDLVRMERLPADPDGTMLAVYGPNPRTRASQELGEGQVEGCVQLLAGRARRMLAGERIDQLADLRAFVRDYWPEPLQVGGRAGAPGEGALTLLNPGPVSRYLSSVAVTLDGVALDPAGITLVNPTVGETGVPFPAATLGPEHGFYVRRHQLAEVRLPVALTPGPHRVELELGLAGVTTTLLGTDLEIA